MSIFANALLVGGYVGAVTVLVRWIPVVRQRRSRSFIVHQVSVAAIVSGWVIHGRASAIIINGAWFVVAAAWYGLAGRRSVTPRI